MSDTRERRNTASVLLLLTLMFALHTFLLMGTGTWSDLAMAGEDFGTMLYYVREGVLAAGFLLCAAFAQRTKAHPLSPKAADIAGIVLVVLFACCTLVLQVSSQPVACVPAVLVVAFLIGISGGMVYERIALAASKCGCADAGKGKAGAFRARLADASRVLGLVVGVGGALAVVLQFAVQTGFSLGGWLLAVCFVVGFALLVWLARKARPAPLTPLGMEGSGSAANAPAQAVRSAGSGNQSVGIGLGVPYTASSRPGIAPLVCMIVAATCLFALLPFYEAVVRATDAVESFYDWHRLFLMIGYLVIGGVAYLGGRPTASVGIVVASLFTIIILMQTALLEEGPFTAILFYTLLGAVLAWSSVAFMSVAPQSRCPALVASMGRILAALVTLAGSLIQVVGEQSMMVVLTGSLVLLAIMVVAMAKGGFLEFSSRAAESPSLPPEEAALSAEERLPRLAREYGLTDREQEVLTALVLTEKKNQQIADELGISRRQIQTYISRIYEKTGVTTRAGLVMLVNGEVHSH